LRVSDLRRPDNRSGLDRTVHWRSLAFEGYAELPMQWQLDGTVTRMAPPTLRARIHASPDGVRLIRTAGLVVPDWARAKAKNGC
jgi:hypothetical protein